MNTGKKSKSSSNTSGVPATPVPQSSTVLTAGLRGFSGLSTLLSGGWAGAQSKARTVRNTLLGGG